MIEWLFASRTQFLPISSPEVHIDKFILKLLPLLSARWLLLFISATGFITHCVVLRYQQTSDFLSILTWSLYNLLLNLDLWLLRKNRIWQKGHCLLPGLDLKKWVIFYFKKWVILISFLFKHFHLEPSSHMWKSQIKLGMGHVKNNWFF